MTRELSPEAAQAAWDAELKLELLDANEEVAECFDSEDVPVYRQRYADAYRRLVGVHPAHRHEFREAMLRARDGGGMPVADVIDVFNRR